MRAEEVKALLAQLASAADTEDSDEWRQRWTALAGGLLDDGTVFDGAYAALPHLIEAAAAMPPGQTVDFWVDLGSIVTAEDRPPVPADLEAGFSAALRAAEEAATRSLLSTGVPAQVCAHLVLACVAFAGHHMGEALWRLRDLREGCLQLVCPGCESDTEIPDFFRDPLHPPVEAPELPDPVRVRAEGHPWGKAAAALRSDALGEGWESFLRVGREVAAAGVPDDMPGQAVLCLVAGMVAAKGSPRRAGREWARTLMSLTGHFRCWDCERIWTIADGLAEHPDGANPQERPTVPLTEAQTDAAGATASATAGRTGGAGTGTRFRQDGTRVLAADGTSWSPMVVFSDSAPGSFGSVDALTVVSRPGRPTLVAGGGDRGVVRLWDVADGRLVHDLLPGHPDRIRSMTAMALPGDRVLLASGGDTGTIAVWNPATRELVREPAGDCPGGIAGMCAAVIPDGRTLLVTATPRGAVRMWDPDTGECVGRLNPYGSPIQSIAAVPLSDSHTLIAASDTAGRLHVWDPAVDDPWKTGAAVQLSARALADADHRVATVATVPTSDRALLATGDDQGVVMLWDLATGTPIGDGLSASTGTAGLPVITATTLRDGRTVLVAGTRHRHRLRIWEPKTGTVDHIALDAGLTCMTTAGADLIVGGDHGVLSLPLARH
ncbi:WD40 repeat domain-containing protein [Streptomyces sp. NPDC099088]|uniref:WD40 repeat domain-containing protein n=1 Tax=Streptomyces sp. NPDC099088 TaxID=3366101 RepID=UPI0037FDB99D